jgi:prophage regulatory protein
VFNALLGNTGETIVLLRIKSVKSETGERSNATVYANIREGLFPKSVQIGRRSVGWPDYEVKAVCAARIAGKSNDEIKELVAYLHTRRSEKLQEILAATHPSGGVA